MKKLCALISILSIVLLFTSCGDNLNTLPNASDQGSASPGHTDGDKLQIVATIFPIYDWTREIAGEKADVNMLFSKGVDLHSFQPSADDIITISDSDIFIYVGGASDEWVTDALSRSNNSDQIVINLMDLLDGYVKEEEIIEGMQSDHDHGHDEHDEHDKHEEHEEEHEYDEHVWLSLSNAEIACQKICDVLSGADPDNASFYTKQAESYIAKLNALDEQYREAVETASLNTVLFGDRFPFRYLTDDYSLDYYAAFVGCSAESEASFETIIFLANKVDELGLPAILTIETSAGEIAETIRKNTASKDQQILVMDSMQSCTDKDLAEGKTYLKTMESNLAVLRQAIN